MSDPAAVIICLECQAILTAETAGAAIAPHQDDTGHNGSYEPVGQYLAMLRDENAALRAVVTAVADTVVAQLGPELGLLHATLNVVWIREQARTIMQALNGPNGPNAPASGQRLIDAARDPHAVEAAVAALLARCAQWNHAHMPIC